VSPSKGFYHCFGCGAHGHAIRFLENYENLSFPQAVEALAEMLGLEVPRTAGDRSSPRDEHDELLALLREADQIYRQALRDSEAAITYLKKRGIDGGTAGRFAMGYAPPAWDTVLRALGTSEARIANLKVAGLVIENDAGRRYDRFRDRIMFPIRNPRGQVIGFGGRVLDSTEPKYMNSPETPVFRKGHELYGLYESRQRPGRPKELIVVEGYLDVASLVQHGIENVVATLGTATTPENIRRLTRLTDRVLFCFDGDTAGRTAAWRAMEAALPFGGGTVEIKFLLLPEGEDPDSFVRKRGAEEFSRLADAAAPLSDFLVKELARRVDFGNVDGRSRFEGVAKPLLRKLPEGVYRAAVMQAFGAELHLPPALLDELMSDPPAERQPARLPVAPRRKTRMQKAIALVLHYPQIATGLAGLERLAELTQPGAGLLRRVLETARALPDVTTAKLVGHLRDDPDALYFDRLLEEEPLDAEHEALQVLDDSLNVMVEEARKARLAAALRTYHPGSAGPTAGN
jgi:DNA primase